MFFDRKPYVRVADRRRQAEREVARQREQGRAASPVVLQGRALATTFWGQAWGANLASYSDYGSRLPRGQSYVRSGAVVDLQVEGGEIRAQVMGSELYEVVVTVAPLSKARWKSICTDCAGSIDSLVELLQGRLSKAVMERVCQQRTGLFPTPDEISLSCTCPDWASMCKHVAAVMYGIGSRFDGQPELAFKLRGVDHADLVIRATSDHTLTAKRPTSAKVLAGEDLSALFGFEIGEAAPPPPKVGPKPAATRRAAPHRPQPARMTASKAEPPVAKARPATTTSKTAGRSGTRAPKKA